jgi:hypothetical protein
MKALIALVGFLASPGQLMGPPQGPGSGAAPPVSPFAITTESDSPLTTEGGSILYTEAAP